MPGESTVFKSPDGWMPGDPQPDYGIDHIAEAEATAEIEGYGPR